MTPHGSESLSTSLSLKKKVDFFKIIGIENLTRIQRMNILPARHEVGKAETFRGTGKMVREEE